MMVWDRRDLWLGDVIRSRSLLIRGAGVGEEGYNFTGLGDELVVFSSHGVVVQAPSVRTRTKPDFVEAKSLTVVLEVESAELGKFFR
jgi:hypothetical protein